MIKMFNHGDMDENSMTLIQDLQKFYHYFPLEKTS